jgi:hypothetical protein
MIQEALDLLERSKELPTPDRWGLPFPMGVFGTLRKNQSNNRRMHAGRVGLHRKAFMPHFVAQGLSIKFNKDASAVFEVFFYTPDEWKLMIPGVDALEGFRPSDVSDKQDQWREFGYWRTLAWLHLLPEDYKHPLYEEDVWHNQRNLQIDPATWSQYPRIPCWVYSSISQNRASKETDTVIWGIPS